MYALRSKIGPGSHESKWRQVTCSCFHLFPIMVSSSSHCNATRRLTIWPEAEPTVFVLIHKTHTAFKMSDDQDAMRQNHLTFPIHNNVTSAYRGRITSMLTHISPCYSPQSVDNAWNNYSINLRKHYVNPNHCHRHRINVLRVRN